MGPGLMGALVLILVLMGQTHAPGRNGALEVLLLIVFFWCWERK